MPCRGCRNLLCRAGRVRAGRDIPEWVKDRICRLDLGIIAKLIFACTITSCAVGPWRDTTAGFTQNCLLARRGTQTIIRQKVNGSALLVAVGIARAGDIVGAVGHGLIAHRQQTKGLCLVIQAAIGNWGREAAHARGNDSGYRSAAATPVDATGIDYLTGRSRRDTVGKSITLRTGRCPAHARDQQRHENQVRFHSRPLADDASMRC